MNPLSAAAAIGAFCIAMAGLTIATPVSAQDEASVTRREGQLCRNGRGDARACTEYGHRLYSGIGAEKDHRTAVRVWRAACDRDNVIACNNMGVALSSSDQIPQDQAEAVRYFARACDGAHIAACRDVGYRRRDGTGVPVDLLAAFVAFERACSLGDGDGCFEGAFFHLNARGMAQNDAEALRLYQRSCELNFNKGCSQVGFMAYSGRGMAVDLTMAVRHYRRACGGGSPVACAVIEQMRASGPGGYGYAELAAAEADGFPSNATTGQRYILASAALANGETARAVSALETLAEEGLADANFILAQMLYTGQGVAMDRPKALRYFQRAANRRHPHAMYVLGQFNWYAIDMTWNPDWGIAMMRGAEEAGLAEAGPIWRQWQAERNAYFDGRDAANRQMAIENERSQAAADAANMQRIWGLYSSNQNQQDNEQVCGMIYRNNQANQECMARETFDAYYNPNR